MEIVKVIQKKQPQAYLVLIVSIFMKLICWLIYRIKFQSLLPRGQFPNPLREKNYKVNELLREQFVGFDRLQVLDVNKGLVLVSICLFLVEKGFDNRKINVAG
jgi:hypothetical protein